ncbi:DUF4190 domain-containing protein [Streptomyces sp. KMM 9044]|uniref:DUF4190 domain-containing protein n=1 Tax=Streptomyces sp. KMM 9044 TaxID=2744474 RepID=UPI002151EFD9|nr:DUF4190 domain-containing protein [Streptomyces sp. KMM 9044]WAX77810.1 DUF4190 domain-containing protein [Streptomyces sp. KMM 9044]
MAVASFVLGVLGLLVLDVVPGPIAVVLAGLALRRGTTRRARACLGLGLVADPLVLPASTQTDDTISRSFRAGAVPGRPRPRATGHGP